MEKNEEYQAWKKERKIFRWVATIAILFYGLESQLTTLSIVYYMMDRYHITKDQVSVYYSIAQSLFAGVQMFSSLVLGRYVDHTRNIRKILIIVMAISSLCNLVYTLPLPIWIVVGTRSLMGVTECLQSAVLGELRRVYNEDKEELISVLNWYEISCQIGRNFGGILLLCASLVSFYIGQWKLDRLNFNNLLLSMACFTLFLFSIFKVKNASRRLDEIRSKYRVVGKKRASSTEQKPLMEWYDFVQFDIVLMLVATSILRYVTMATIAYTTLLTTTVYAWKANNLFAMFFVTNIIAMVSLTLLAKWYVVKGAKRAFYLFILALVAGAVLLISFMLTKAGLLDTFTKQLIFFGMMKIGKSICLYFTNTSGSFLLFSLVSPENSSSIAGFKSFFNVSMKCLSYLTAFKAAYLPEYASPPVAIFIFICAYMLLYRRGNFLK
ncbi:uncharacterized protein [Clytia hemisphaerica]|uniref:Uncharacterized protein n=1 Tax=Clytia hemisphaerica TaxID=252671 RepID=A0A7M5V8L9_9CNID